MILGTKRKKKVCPSVRHRALTTPRTFAPVPEDPLFFGATPLQRRRVFISEEQDKLIEERNNRLGAYDMPGLTNLLLGMFEYPRGHSVAAKLKLAQAAGQKGEERQAICQAQAGRPVQPEDRYPPVTGPSLRQNVEFVLPTQVSSRPSQSVRVARYKTEETVDNYTLPSPTRDMEHVLHRRRPSSQPVVTSETVDNYTRPSSTRDLEHVLHRRRPSSQPVVTSVPESSSDEGRPLVDLPSLSSVPTTSGRNPWTESSSDDEGPLLEHGQGIKPVPRDYEAFKRSISAKRALDSTGGMPGPSRCSKPPGILNLEGAVGQLQPHASWSARNVGKSKS